MEEHDILRIQNAIEKIFLLRGDKFLIEFLLNPQKTLEDICKVENIQTRMKIANVEPLIVQKFINEIFKNYFQNKEPEYLINLAQKCFCEKILHDVMGSLKNFSAPIQLTTVLLNRLGENTPENPPASPSRRL